ncbi:hypothetical protein [Pseudomonas thivervalensis]|uniref:hypothetical protein n=1 Tax=Pseudomonas thivervalensis TaxID=86265 RepID=UPI003D969E09
MADYINKSIISQAYMHIEPTKLNSVEAVERFKRELRGFAESRIAFFLGPNLPIAIDFEEGSLIVRITVIGTISLLLQGVANYKDFREGIQLIYADSKRVTEYIIANASFEAGARQEDVIRLEARMGVIGSIQKLINQLDAIRRGANGLQSCDILNAKIDEAIIDLEKLLNNVRDPNDQALVTAGILEISNKIPSTPRPPRETINSEAAIFEFRRRRHRLLSVLLSRR